MENKLTSNFRYKIEMTYVDSKSNKTITFKNESLKSLIIDHNYDKNHMPILYATLSLDRLVIDDMILNINKNFITIALYKYNELLDNPIDIECFRDRFTYFLPDDVNKNNDIDYNEKTEDENMGDTYRNISIGLLSITHINDNKRSIEINAKNTTKYDCVKYFTSHIDNLLIEPFNYNEVFDQLIIPALDSVKKALEFINNYRVFYKTPYRYYQDFDCTYIVSSSGLEIPRKNDFYNSIIFNIREITSDDANEIGLITNKSNQSYEIIVNSLDTSVYDNSISNKSRNAVKGITSTGSSVEQLKNNALYSTEKINNIRLNNDNEHMMENIIHDYNSSNVFINICKNNLDTSIFTLNKRISINNIDRYSENNGNYLLSRKREIYIREDDTFNMQMVLNLRKIN